MLQGTPAAAQKDPFPIWTVLMNLGLAQGDVLSVGDEIMRRAKGAVATKALSDDADERRRYMGDHIPPLYGCPVCREAKAYRERVNTVAIATACLGMGFNTEELRALAKWLGIPLVSPERQPKTARTIGPAGPDEFEFLEEPGPGEVGVTVLRSKITGRTFRIRPDRPGLVE